MHAFYEATGGDMAYARNLHFANASMAAASTPIGKQGVGYDLALKLEPARDPLRRDYSPQSALGKIIGDDYKAANVDEVSIPSIKKGAYSANLLQLVQYGSGKC